MGAYIYSDELIEKCEDDLAHIAEKIQHYKETIRKQQLTLAALLAKKESIELAMSQLRVHAPNSWCRSCKTDTSESGHLPQCSQYKGSDPKPDSGENRSVCPAFVVSSVNRKCKRCGNTRTAHVNKKLANLNK